MAAPVCELCGGTEFVKSDGMFVCQGCGTKYSPEEAQALMQNSTGALSAQAKKVTDMFQQGQAQPPADGWQGQELRSVAEFNPQAININAAGPRGVNNYACQAWQLIIEEYNGIEHPDKAQLDTLVSRAKECLMLLNGAVLLDPANNPQCCLILDNCVEIEKSVKSAKYWEQAEDGSWKSKTLSFFDDVQIAGQNESWETKRDSYHNALEQLYMASHPDDVARKQQLEEEAAGVQAQLDELKDEKRSKGFFNFKEKGEVKERMKPFKEQLSGINREINAINNAASDFADAQVDAIANAYIRLDF